MRAAILAAGRGARLGEPEGPPKCLMRFGGRSLLERHLRSLEAVGVTDVSMVVGYRHEAIREEVRRLGREVAFVVNEDFDRGSVVSLWSLRESLRTQEDLLLMDADVLYELEILRRLATSGHASALLLDPDFVPGDEPVKICVRDGQIVEFRKRVAADLRFDRQGESVGFFKLAPETAAALAERCGAYVDDGRLDEPYEEALRDLALGEPERFGIEDVGGLAWVEIDFPEDIDRAAREILPHVDA